MNNPSDTEELHSQVLFLKMRAKSTEELISVWTENNQKAWSRDEFDAIQEVLLERLDKLPEQKTTNEAKVVTEKKRGIETVYVSFHDLSPYNQFRAAIAIVCIIGLCFGAIVVRMVDENTNLFWRFAENSTASDIEKIEFQRIDQNGNGIGKAVSVSNDKSIGGFVSALKTIEEYQPNHPSPENEFSVKIWLTKNRTIEFYCYTMEGEGNTIFVGYLWAKPGVYSFGNGNAKFSAPDFYEWLINNGMEIPE